jgi:dihydrofolate reductase
MIISIISAMANQRVIGINNSLPWKLPSDMKWFRQHTLGKPIVMGRKTFESFGGRTLPDRPNIIITHDQNYEAKGAIVTHSIEEALQAAAANSGDSDEVMIIGGASFYRQMLPEAQRMYLTFVHADIEGDAWFPDYEASEWKEVERVEVKADEKNPYDHDFVILERI